jgi:hypothetical protein
MLTYRLPITEKQSSSWLLYNLDNTYFRYIILFVKSLCYILIVVRYFKMIFSFNKRARASSFLRFIDHTQRRITVGRTHLEEWSASRRDFYPTHNIHRRQTPMPQTAFEPTISAGERSQTYALDRLAAGIGSFNVYWILFWIRHTEFTSVRCNYWQGY